jgi:hypothetical protein
MRNRLASNLIEIILIAILVILVVITAYQLLRPAIPGFLCNTVGLLCPPK